MKENLAALAYPMKNENLQILILDDDKDVADIVRDTLEYEGFQVRLASDGEQALQFIQKSHYDAALIDLQLQGPISGLEVIRKIRNNPDRPKILVVSGISKSLVFSTLEEEKLSAWVDGILEKPQDLQPERLYAKIRQICKMGGS